MVVVFFFYAACVHALLKYSLNQIQDEIYNFLWSWYIMVLILTSDRNLTACQVGGETGTNREQLNKLPLCCQVLGGRKRRSGSKKELEPLLKRARSPRGWGVRRKREREKEEWRWLKAHWERKQRVKTERDKEAEGDGKSERQSRGSTKMREQKRLDMISMECLLTVLRGPGPWDKWLNTAPVKARGFLWACVSLCAFCWREGSSQLIDTELSMKRTKRSPLLPWLASPPKRGLPASLRLQMKHTRAHTNAHTFILRSNQTCANIQAWIRLQK